MNWRLILLYSLLSVPITLVSIFGFLPNMGVEFGLWAILGCVIAWLLGQAARRPFLSGFMTGLLMGIWSHLLSIALWGTYVANNPELAAQLNTAAAEKGMSPQVFQLISAPMVGVTYGIVLGLLTWLVSRITKPKQPAPVTD